MAKNDHKEQDGEKALGSAGEAQKKTKHELSPQLKKNMYQKGSKKARENGRKGGIASAESRRNKREARESIRYLLELAAKKNLESNLQELGFPEDELTNMNALHARLFTMAMGGNLEAYLTLMKMGGYDPEENRKERESVAADRRREAELEAKVSALNGGIDGAQMAVNLKDEDEYNDVVIYMPEIDSEESCTVTDDEEGQDDKG